MSRTLLKLSIPLLAGTLLFVGGRPAAAPLPHDYGASWAVKASGTQASLGYAVERVKQHRKFEWRKGQVSPSAHPRIRRVWARVALEFPEVGNLGVFNCRFVRGGSSWSQHAYGRAIDIAPRSAAEGDRIERYVRQRFGNRVYIIWRQDPVYHFPHHLHIEVSPRATWRPGCH